MHLIDGDIPPPRPCLQAIGIVIGGAFTALINAFVSDFITPLISAIWGGADFSALAFYINSSKFAVGEALFSFCFLRGGP